MAVNPSEISYSAAISSCEKGRQWQMALSLLSQMPDARLSPNLLCFAAAVLACVKCNRWRDTFVLLDDMLGFSLEPNPFTLSTLLAECEQRGLLSTEQKLATAMCLTQPFARSIG
ncbi:unnamed protein product [Polarella glacialis]|nr:unnamed protein product [Polarella glacialis]